MKPPRLLAAALAAALLAACAGPVVKLGDVTRLDDIDTHRGEVLQASASGFQLLLFIPIAINARQARAMEDLRAQAGDRLLGNVKVTESWRYGLVGTVHTTTLEATAYPRRHAAAHP
ncbi:MAG: hypothetical protein REI09_03750 [Candidatus Dactylopiibacterium sp.]|nr:hypothetical protein [Candidatus Dactylopiibacterium sp.]